MISTIGPPITVRDLRKTYRSGFLGRKRHEALRGISLEVGRGQVFGLLGPNGAGKTTMIKVLLGLVRSFEGEAQLFGEPVGRAALRQRVGYLPEAHQLPPYLTARQVLSLFGQFSGVPRKELVQRIPHWLERVGIPEAADRKVKEFSKGMKQRLGLAQALIHEPDLVFLDEPTDGVDPRGRKDIRAIVAEARERGATLFVNSHLLQEVQQMCDSIVILSNGRIVKSGTTEELASETRSVKLTLGSSSVERPAALLEGVGSNLHVQEDGLTLEVEDDDLQVAIDRLRAAGVPILGIERKRLTLEDAFLLTLDDEEGESPASQTTSEVAS